MILLAIESLKTPQLVLALIVAVGILAIVVELVRRQKLREEYAYLWISTAIVLMTLAVFTDILAWLTGLVEAQSPVSILYFGALLFLMLVALQFSVRLTKLTYRSKTANQRIALLEAEIEQLRADLGAHAAALESDAAEEDEDDEVPIETESRGPIP